MTERTILEAVQAGEAALTADAAVIERLMGMTGDLAVNIVIAVLILVVTIFAARAVGWLVRRALSRMRSLKGDQTVPGFVAQAARVAVMVVGLIAILHQLGVQTTSIIAVVGAASLAIGLALQGALSNVAAGVVLLILRPYRVGDTVDIGGVIGEVRRLELFTTRLLTGDNVRIFVPNAQVLGGVVRNITAQRTRRIEIAFTVGYGADLNQARAVIAAVAEAHAHILAEPPPWTGVTGLLDSAVQITLRAWAPAPDWWQTRADLHQQVKEALDAAGIEIPFPHQVSVEYRPPAPRKPSARKPAARKAGPGTRRRS